MKNILIVDDDQAVCSMLKDFLSQRDYDTTVATSGEEALQKIKEDKFDMVLLDVRMPGMDGVQTLKNIKEMNKELGVIMVTAVADEETGQKCLKLGANAYVIKPLSLSYLENVISIWLE